MCRCLQNLWEDFYWHCIEEKFCFDETIAYYNPDEDEAANQKKQNSLGRDAGAGFSSGDRKNSEIIVNQPLARHCSILGAKAHEDEFQREIQTTVPILAPEVMAAFAHSQIFHENSAKPKAALARIETKAKIMAADVTGSSDQDAAAEKLLSRLEGISVEEGHFADEGSGGAPVAFKLTGEELVAADQDYSKVKTFHSIAEEADDDEDEDDAVDLRYRREMSLSSQTLSPSKKRPLHLRLKHVQSVPQFPTYPNATVSSLGEGGVGGGGFRPWSQASETMTRDGVFIIATPELPAISLKRLPRNYLDTPSLDEYHESSSLSSIQMRERERSNNTFNFQMPRYYGRSELYLPTPAISQEEINRANLRAKQNRVPLKKNQSMVNLNHRSASPDPPTTFHNMQPGRSEGHLRGDVHGVDKSKRLKVLRGHLPPLMIQTKDKTGAEKDRH